MVISRVERGFTLIELLIVVAIIGILAAIAIPNFMNAQVRAKTSRAQADMASLTTALEAYCVDNGCYVDANRTDAAADPDDDPYMYKLIPLSSPVSYIKQIPGSAFAGFLPFGANIPVKTYYYQTKAACDWMESQGWGTDIWLQYDRTGRRQWYLSCVGPDGAYDQPWSGTPGCNEVIYDPTNGITSDGDIIRLGP